MIHLRKLLCNFNLQYGFSESDHIIFRVSIQFCSNSLHAKTAIFFELMLLMMFKPWNCFGSCPFLCKDQLIDTGVEAPLNKRLR